MPRKERLVATCAGSAFAVLDRLFVREAAEIVQILLAKSLGRIPLIMGAGNGSGLHCPTDSILETSVKKNIAGILVAAAFLTLDCLCCPTNIIKFGNPPVATPPKPTIAPVAIPTPADVVPICVQNLEQVLEESESLTSPSRGPQPDREYTLVTYAVKGDAITEPVYGSVPNNLRDYQQDTAAQEKIWDFITKVIPADQRTMVTGFVLYTDGTSESLGAVEQTDSPYYWMFEMDLIDGGTFPELATTVIHEFAHLLTLNDSQVTTDYPVFENPDDQHIYDREAATCPTHFTFEGCSQADSYLNIFFNRFWTDIYAEWQAVDAETDQDLIDQKLNHFYQKYASQFVSEYAATSPSEDIAETFMVFIFVPRPSGTTITDQKVLSFYEYPELVALREQILSNLCTYVDKP